MEIKAGNRKFRISVFDILVIILVILLALGFVYIRHHRGGTESVMEQIYQIEINDVNPSTEGMIQPGDPVIDKVKKLDMGEVVSVEYIPETVSTLDLENHKMVESELPGKESAIITMKAECTDNGTKITTTGGYDLAVGTRVSMIGPGYSGAGYIITMDRGEE